MDECVFPGFWHPDEQQGFTQLPNELFDLLPKLCETELKVLLYIFRHTWGFREYEGLKKLTTDELMKGRKRKDGSRMDEGTGLSHWGVLDGIAKAVKHGYIVSDRDDRDKGRIKKCYGIHVYRQEE